MHNTRDVHIYTLKEQYIGEMETRSIKKTEMVLAISRAKTPDRHLSRWNLFDRLFKAVILVVLPSTSDTPPNHGQFWR